MNLIDKWVAMRAVQGIDSVATLRDGDPVIRMSAVEHVLENLPETEPDTTTHDSIPVKNGRNDEDRTSGDCISRAQAIDTLRKMQTYKLFAGDDLILIDQAEAQTELMMLPSAQPDIIRCPDCYYNDGTAYCELHFRNVKAKDFCSWAERRRGCD